MSQKIWTPGWEPLGGSFDTSGVPALVPGSNGSVDLYVPYGGSLYQKNLAGGVWGAWSAAEVVSMSSTVTMSAGVSAALRGSGLPTIYMAARGSDAATWVRTRLVGGSWNAWTSLLGSTPYAPAVSSTSNGTVQVWSSGGDNNLYLKRYTGSWGSWAGYVLPGGVTTTGPAAAVGAGTAAYVAVLGSDNNYYVGSYNESTTTWNGWTNVGRGGSTTGLKPPALAYWFGLSLFTVDSSTLWEKDNSFGTWSSWTDSPSRTVSNLDAGDAIIPPPTTAPAALATSSTSLHMLIRSGSAGSAYHRLDYLSTPTATVALSPDRSMLGMYQGSTPVGCDPTGNVGALWESVAVAAPPGKAGCGDAGALLFNSSNDLGQAPNTEHNIWRGDLDCFAPDGGPVITDAGVPVTCSGSNSQRCNMNTRYNVYSADAGWDAGLIINGGGPPDGGGYGAADDQIVRAGDAGAAFLMLKGAQVGTNAGVTSTPTRGSYVVYKSGSCGSSWSLASVIDSCDSSLGFSTTYCPYGLDREEISVNPADPNKVLVPVRAGTNATGTQANSILYRSSNAGSNWTAAKDSAGSSPIISDTGGATWAAPVGGDLTFFLYPYYDSLCPSTSRGYRPALAFYSESTTRLAHPSGIVGGQARPYFTSDCAAQENPGEGMRNLYTISPVGTYGNDSFVRVSFPLLDANGGQKFRVYVVRVNSYATVDGTFDIAAASGSINHLNVVYPTNLDGAPPSTVALYYWYESDSRYPSQGQARVKGCIVRDTSTTCTPVVLSLDSANATRTWPYDNGAGGTYPPGDYLKSAAVYRPDDPNGQTIHFLVHWLETPNVGVSLYAAHMNLVKVAP